MPTKPGCHHQLDPLGFPLRLYEERDTIKKIHVTNFGFSRKKTFKPRMSAKSKIFVGTHEEEGASELIDITSFGLGAFEELKS
jgi:hypothetical protein